MRVDPVLWAELESWAQEELRSVNGQVEMILRQAIRKRKGQVALRTKGDGANESPSVKSK